MQSERMQGFAADLVYVKGEVFAYVGLPRNLKDLRARAPTAYWAPWSGQYRGTSFIRKRHLPRT